MNMRTLLAGAIAATLSLAIVPSSSADPIKCQRDLAKASAKYVQGRAKALDKCEQGKTKGQFPPSTNCLTEPSVTPKLSMLDLKLSGSIAKSCGGADKTCGTADDEPLASIGWGGVSSCPDFESSGCTNPIANCNDITSCLECFNDAAVDQAITLYYGALDSGQFGTGSAVNKCQQAIGKSTVKFLGARSKAMQKCWDARFKGQHSMTCPADATGKTVLLIQKAETKKQDSICKACGGADKTCDGNGDLTPGAIGFASSCPAVTTFASDNCAGAISSASAIVDCVDCVTTFKTDCTDAVAVPGFMSPLPSNCNPGAPTTTSSTSPASTSSSSTAPTPTTTSSTSPTPTTSSTSSPPTTSSTSPGTTSSTSSSTSTSTSSSSSTTIGGGPSAFDFLSTAGTGVCGNTFRDMGGVTPLKNLLCANLSLGGGLSQVPDNTTPSGSTNRFGLSCSGPSCTVGPVSGATTAYDCTNTGCLFGTPLPISNAGLSVCVTNSFSSPVSGTLNTGSGAVTLDLELNSATVLTGNPTQPCPICAVSVGGAACSGSPASPCTGVCDGSPNQGSACTTKNPNGLTSACPAPAAVTGASRCYRGTSNNAVCSTSANCPGGSCALFIGNIAVSLNPLTTGVATLASAAGTFCPGQGAAQQGAFKDDICRTGPNSGKPCQTGTMEAVDAANCGAGGLCRPGSLNNYCQGGTNDGKGCVSATDCGTGGSCVRAGAIVTLIRETGVQAGALTVGTPKPITLASVFCVANTSSPLVNANANLPGPGATSLVGTVTLIP